MKQIVEWQYYPKTEACPQHLLDVIKCFEKNHNEIDSHNHELKSDDVLKVICNDLINCGYSVEKSKSKEDKIKIPVLYGRNGNPDKTFDADGYSYKFKTVIEVEAGRGYANHQFLKDLFEACVMQDVDYSVIAIRRLYRDSHDFERVSEFIETLYSSPKFKLPLKGVLIIGY